MSDEALAPDRPVKRHMRPNHAARFVSRYGANWKRELTPLDIEMDCIRWGGRWISPSGKECGLGLEYHYKAMDRLLWPDEMWDEWDAKIDRQLIRGGVQGLSGASSSGKTNRMSKFALRMYWCFPEGFTGCVSTTTLKDLEGRIWGEIKSLYNRAKERYPDLPGYLRESSQSITTRIEQMEGSDFRNGIKGVPCKIGNRWVGLGPYSGIKNKRVAIFADEGHLMPAGYFDIAGNLASNDWWLIAAAGNPYDPTSSFGQVCEPKCGWDLLEQGDGDQTWESRTGEVLRLDGLFAPNLIPGPGKEPCRGKIKHRYINWVRETYGEGSFQWEMWVRARFVLAVMERRLFVRKYAERYRAFDEPFWADSPLVDLFAIDAAYGSIGGDRCVGGHFKFGRCVDGRIRLALRGDPMLIPVKAGGDVLPEHQIVYWTRDYCKAHDIIPSHVGLDSTGRGSLVSAFSGIWSPDVVAIEFGGLASDRPDPQNPKRTAREAYGNFCSEIAFAFKECIGSDQFRGLTLDIAMEAEQRAWKLVNKPERQQVETKDETRDRIKRSPDLLDMAVCGVELARRLGFIINSAQVAATVSPDSTRALQRDARAWQETNDDKALEYA